MGVTKLQLEPLTSSWPLWTSWFCDFFPGCSESGFSACSVLCIRRVERRIPACLVPVSWTRRNAVLPDEDGREDSAAYNISLSFSILQFVPCCLHSGFHLLLLLSIPSFLWKIWLVCFLTGRCCLSEPSFHFTASRL